MWRPTIPRRACSSTHRRASSRPRARGWRRARAAGPGSFAPAGTRLGAGRATTWPEVYGLQPVVTISENLARELWGTPAAALGRHLRISPTMPWHEIIGVVQDVRENGFYAPPPPTVYWPTMSTY